MLLQVLLFACVGIAMEVFFTAITEYPRRRCNRLMGHSYVWMALTYGSAPLLLAVIYPPLESAPLVGRLTVYVAVLYAIEYTAGWLLRCALGRCPWDYGRARWSVHGLIRLDYLPAWAAACLIFESLWLELRVL
ncbi:MAG TPA: hypothetical protein VKZ63_06770 [Kofleriaceae bacterium]|nr:hypothetical protein [Kofleriaceae bacterium]